MSPRSRRRLRSTSSAPRGRPIDLAPDTRGNVWFAGSEGTGGAPLGRLPGVGGTQPPPTNQPPTNQPPTNQPPTNQPPATIVVGTGTAKATLTDPTIKGTTMKVNQICVGPPQDKCSLVYLIDSDEYVTGFPGSKGLAAAAAAKRTTLGQLKITLKGGESKQVTIKLNAKGKKLLKKIKKFKARLTITQTVTGQKKPKTILKKNVTLQEEEEVARARRASSTVAPRRSPGLLAGAANATRVAAIPRGVRER